MPEGHTIHRLATRHQDLFAGRVVRVSSPQGRFAGGAELLGGQTLAGTEAYGKHLLHHFGSGATLHIHLGLYGKFSDGAVPAPAPIGQVRMRMVSDERWLDLRGPTACEVFDEHQVAALIGRLGADPLRDDAEPEAAYRKIVVSSRAIFAMLLDQSIVAGCGLIYANEVLFRAGLSPTLPGRAITPAVWESLWTDLRELMKEGVVRGRIDTVHTSHTPEAMRRAPRVDRHGGEVYVYRRTGLPCHVCGTAVARGELAARNLYWCPTCQPVRAAAGRKRAAAAPTTARPGRPAARRGRSSR